MKGGIPIYQTTLSQSILFSLSVAPASNLTKLAQELGQLRPSVSRAMKQLEHECLVRRDGWMWSITEQGRQVVKTKEDAYTTQIQPLLLKIAKIAKQHDIPFVVACEVDGWLKIEKHHVNACSEIFCAYGELTGWNEDS